MAHQDLHVRLDRASDVPVGTQLAWKLRGAIAARRLQPGDRLPGVRELAAAAGVNVNTVRAVYSRLAEQGAIVSQHGRGTFVADVGDQDELVRLAERTARDARRSGIDPRALAALLYAEPSAAPTEAAVRRALRGEIEALERRHAALERELAALDERPAPAAAPGGARRRTGPRLLSTPELEVTRDDLAERVTALHAQLAAVRERDRRRGEGSRGIAASVPETVVSGGTWTLRWRL